MIKSLGIHHVAIICSDYERSKSFYLNVLGFSVLAEHYREDRKSWKLDLAINGEYQIELFSFPDPPQRVSRPEARGLRHLAIAVDDVADAMTELAKLGVDCEPIRTDEHTGKRFCFLQDPDGLPIELYER